LLRGAHSGAGSLAKALRTRSFITKNVRSARSWQHYKFGRVRRPKKVGKKWKTCDYNESDDEKAIATKKKAGLLDRKAVKVC
jgi:hypothetical protein